MSDIALVLDPASLRIDMMLDGPDLRTDSGMGTAILISLFSDALARPEDVIPDGSGDRRGWWGDEFSEVPGDHIGSRRWLLARAKLTPETLRRIADFDTEALAWMKADGIAASIEITVTRSDDIEGASELIVITRPDGSVGRFSYVWNAYV